MILESLNLDGGLVLVVPDGTEVLVKDVTIVNKGTVLVPVAPDEPDEVRGAPYLPPARRGSSR